MSFHFSFKFVNLNMAPGQALPRMCVSEFKFMVTMGFDQWVVLLLFLLTLKQPNGTMVLCYGYRRLFRVLTFSQPSFNTLLIKLSVMKIARFTGLSERLLCLNRLKTLILFITKKIFIGAKFVYCQILKNKSFRPPYWQVFLVYKTISCYFIVRSFNFSVFLRNFFFFFFFLFD